MKQKKPLVSIIIPVFNEAKTVNELLSRVYQYKNNKFNKEIIIVESFGTDGSREIVKEFIRGKHKIKLILEDKPKGKGHAVQEGIKASKGEVILIQDADLEYSVDDYEKVLTPIFSGKANFVLGSRHLNDQNSFSWRVRKFKGLEIPYAYIMNISAIIIHTFFNKLYGVSLSDPTTMYKVFTKKLYNKITPRCQRFDFDWELVCKFIRLGNIPIEVPIKYESRSPSQGKKIVFFKDGISYIKTILKCRSIDISRI